MERNSNKLTVIDGETLMDQRLPPTKFCVDTLIPQGLCILGGAPKVGKSWLVLDLCIHIAKGEPIWNLSVTKGEVLYLCLEDSQRRIQERLNIVTDDVPPGIYFATGHTSLEEGLIDWLRSFKKEHPLISFVAIDTFQMVRHSSVEVSYSGDYAEMQPLKALAEELQISLLLVHHLRKLSDRDPLNKLSGSTGIIGSVDAVFVLDKDDRVQRSATLIASGRDIRDRKMRLELDAENCRWSLLSDSLVTPESVMPEELSSLLDFMRETPNYTGSNTDLAETLSHRLEKEVNANALKRMMNRWRFALEEQGVFFESKRSNGRKFVKIHYLAPVSQLESASSASGDDISSVLQFSVPPVPVVSDEESERVRLSVISPL
jgi:hypothetical protein